GRHLPFVTGHLPRATGREGRARDGRPKTGRDDRRVRCSGRVPLAPVLVGAVLFGPLAAGCNSLPAGPLDAVRPTSASARRGEVYLIRGWNGLWSQGVDELAARLGTEGVEAHTYQQGQAAELGDAIRDRYRAAAGRDPLVLIGF